MIIYDTLIVINDDIHCNTFPLGTNVKKDRQGFDPWPSAANIGRKHCRVCADDCAAWLVCMTPTGSEVERSPSWTGVFTSLHFFEMLTLSIAPQLLTTAWLGQSHTHGHLIFQDSSHFTRMILQSESALLHALACTCYKYAIPLFLLENCRFSLQSCPMQSASCEPAFQVGNVYGNAFGHRFLDLPSE